jgi:hypothetical protein
MRNRLSSRRSQRKRLEMEYLEGRSQPAWLNFGLQVAELVSHHVLVGSMSPAANATPAAELAAPAQNARSTDTLLVVMNRQSVEVIDIRVEVPTQSNLSSGTGSSSLASTTPASGATAPSALSTFSFASASSASRTAVGSPSLASAAFPATDAILLPPTSGNSNPADQTPIAAPPPAFPPVTTQLLVTNAGLSTLTGSLSVPVGGADGIGTPVAPPPRLIEGGIIVPAPAIEASPLPGDTGGASAAEAAAAPAVTLAPVGEQASNQPAQSASTPPAEQEGLLDRTWGWVGAVAAALSVGGYWMLRRARLLRRSNRLPRWAAKSLPLGTLFSTDLDAA